MLSINNISSAYPSDFEQQNFQILAQHQNSFQFQQQTRINITTNVDLEGEIHCQSLQIFNKEFELEIISAEGDMNLNMTCTEEQAALGLLNGHRITARNRNRLRYQEGFCINISTNCTQIQAKLKIKATEQNRLGTWAYFNESTMEWVSTSTIKKDGYLITTTDHFSVWTILIQEQDIMIYIGISIAVVALIGLIGILYYKRR